MTHDRCGTYGGDWERCPICGLAYCPRCRTWFSDGMPASMPVDKGGTDGG